MQGLVAGIELLRSHMEDNEATQTLAIARRCHHGRAKGKRRDARDQRQRSPGSSWDQGGIVVQLELGIQEANNGESSKREGSHAPLQPSKPLPAPPCGAHRAGVLLTREVGNCGLSTLVPIPYADSHQSCSKGLRIGREIHRQNVKP